MAWTYMLECGDGSLYVGSTRYVDLSRRVDQHASGKGSAYTGCRLPVRLVWAQEFDTVYEAWLLERKIHGWGRAKREALVRGDFDVLPGLSTSKSAQLRPASPSSRPSREDGPGGPVG